MRPHSSNSIRTWPWLACIAWLGMSSAFAAEVTAELDRREIVAGETVTLVLQTNDSQQSLETDLAVLERDFHVVDRRSETQMSIAGGRQSAVVRLLLTLEPKRSGALQIPALRFAGGATTRPLSIEVQPAPQLAPGELPPVFIETELEPLEGPYYVHAQLSLKVRIFYQQNLTEAAINPPAPQQASVRLLDEVPYQADKDGNRYRVLERRYAIFPERSGELTIPPMQLTGRLIERPADRLWQPSVRGRRIRIESDPLTLTVKPKPPQFTGEHWLPARRIDLSQQISDADEIRVGEPVTRTVILDAVGLEEHMLEEPVWPPVEAARIYPDQPQGISRDNGEWVLGHREFRYAVVPERAGEMLLPEIRLVWWDTVADRQRTAILPEHRVEVLPSELAGLNLPQQPLAGTDTALQEPGGGGNGSVTRWRMMTALFAFLWLITLGFAMRGGRERTQGAAKGNGTLTEEAALLKSLKQACGANDAREARHLLGRWVRLHGPARADGSLMQFAGLTSDELAAEIRRLDALRFRQAGAQDWDGRGLWQVLRAWFDAVEASKNENGGADYELFGAARAMKTL